VATTRIPSQTEPPEFLLEAIREGAEFTLYRARQQGNPSPVLVVAATAGQPLPHSLLRLEHEYSLAAELEPTWAAKPLALSRHEGRSILVLADPGGEPLDRVLELDKEQPLDLARFLRLAVNLARALDHVHQRGLIHKDFKPENVLVDDAGNVWLTGFGIASRLPRERQALAPPEIIAGTLAYMSPEQTGRMIRSIDTRSDLYSLGVTLYRMLTGVLPFAAADPLEWVHCHIARQPVAPADRRAVPEPLSAIIMKLLAKKAEERYQTAAGLEADLRRCLAEWQSHGRIDTFPLGTNDLSDRLLIPEKLYGREREVDALLAAFDRVVAQGTAELVLVSGYSGVGKSSVVNELHKVLVPPRGLFAAGKFDQYKQDVPYATMAQAFQGLLRPLLTKSESELSEWRQAFREAVDPNGQLIVDLLPELKFIIGEQPPVPEVSPQDAQARFHQVFARFISVFARHEHPLALFLDDLQWLDAATLDLIADLLTRSEARHFVLIGAYRDNEVGPTHPLMRKLEAIREAGAIVQNIVLAPLSFENLAQLIADSVHCEPERVATLAELVHQKTAGNPFFAIQFISALAEEGLLTFDRTTARWVWHLNRIRAKSHTDNVVDLVVGKLSRLPTGTQEALRQLACFGNSAEFTLLRVIYRDSTEEMHSELWEAVRTGFIFRSGDSYRFLHDRVQEAAYSLIPKEMRAETHLRTGRLLAERIPSHDRAERIFEIVNQFNRATHLVTSNDERKRVAEFNLIAARRAKVSIAYASTLSFLERGRSLLTEERWDTDYELIFSLEHLMAECELLTADMEVAERRLSRLATRANGAHDLALVTCLQLMLYTAMDRVDRGVEICLEYLRRDGTIWSAHPTDDEVQREYDRIWSQLGDRKIEDLLDAPLVANPDILDVLDVLVEFQVTAMFFDQDLCVFVICRMLNLSLEHGNCDASCFAYIWFGIIAGQRFGNYEGAFKFGQLGYDLMERRDLKRYEARNCLCFEVVVTWTKHARRGRDLLRHAFDAAYRMGDFTYAAYSLCELIPNFLVVGDPLAETQAEAEKGVDFAKKARVGLAVDMLRSNLQLIRTLRGLTNNFGSFNGNGFDEAEFERHLASNPALASAGFAYWPLKAQARFFAGDYASAVDASLKAQQLLWADPTLLTQATFRFYGALSHAAAWDSAAPGERQEHLDGLEAHHKQFEIWADHCPENFENRAALVGAEIARIEGRLVDAEGLYEKAIHSARANGFIHNEAVAYEVAARFYAARGFQKFADAYLLEARYCYQRWGADGKVRQFDQIYPHLRVEEAVRDTTSTIVTPTEFLDLATVIRVSQAVSGEMVLEKLIEKLVRIAMENAGAARGLLILLRGEDPRIEAEATTGPGGIEVAIRQAAVTPSDLPHSALHYVIRTLESVLLDDASTDTVYSKDEYVRQKHSKSILCLPIVNQSKLVGVLFLENNMAPGAFTADRVTVLELLASQAAISLENVGLYSDLQRSEGFLAQGERMCQTGSFGWNVSSGEIYWSDGTYNIFGYDRTAKPTVEMAFQRVHPDDRDRLRQAHEHAIKEKTDFNVKHRLLMPDGTVKHCHVIGHALQTSSGDLEFVGAGTDITVVTLAEEKIRQSESELRQILDVAPQHVYVLGPDPDTRLYVNQAALDYLGLTPGDWRTCDRRKLFHPDDWERARTEAQSKIAAGLPHEVEERLLGKDGKYRWFLLRWNPLRDEHGRLTRWFVAGTDIEDRKAAEQRLLDENVSLREELDEASMFEEIVGSSAALKRVLSCVSKVAPTDSSVLITGETGTGKELVARAIHRRSRRSSQTFVSVNCAAIPRDLIASELFGHEKGAFTGATQRRLGRFELAEKGTIFLDEVGELPEETQIALLRVLQEHEFERIGGTGTIRADVRVIAATNRDLESAIAAGKFRSDLFYRLNVFPVEMPPLRERREDIPLLVRYFLNRYARKAGRRFTAVDKKSLDLLQAYTWPGNIRELQNVIERSVIVSETETFSVDGSWLSRCRSTVPDIQPGLFNRRPAQEKAIIEAALRECAGRVSGPSGAAARLRIPGSTLESKIKALKINKNRFKGTRLSQNS